MLRSLLLKQPLTLACEVANQPHFPVYGISLHIDHVLNTKTVRSLLEPGTACQVMNNTKAIAIKCTIIWGNNTQNAFSFGFVEGRMMLCRCFSSPSMSHYATSDKLVFKMSGVI